MGADGERIDVARAALWIAAEEYPGLDVAAYLRRLDELAERAAPDAPEGVAFARRVAGLNRALFVREGYSGNRDAYEDPRNSFLNQVLDRRTGIPITLCLVYTEVARRLGLDARGIGFPGHFLAKVVGPDGSEILIDAFAGSTCSERECRALFARVAGASAEWRPQAYLRPATPREILVRMLSNLKHVAFRERHFDRALSYCDRILLVTPDAPLELRDRGLVYEQLGWPTAAAADLDRFLELAPDDPAADALRERVAALRRAAGPLH